MSKEQMDGKEWKKNKKKIMAELDKMPPPVVERKEACFHLTLRKIIRDDVIYVCEDCGVIVQIVGSALYQPENFVAMAKNVMSFLDYKAMEDKKTEKEKDENS